MPTDDLTENNLSAAERQLVDALKNGGFALSLHREFEKFHPLSSPVSEFPLAGYARQAREILANRNKQEIGYAVMIAEWGVQVVLAKEAPGIEGRSFDEWANFIGQPDETLPRVLQRRRALIGIKKLTDLPNAKWQEIFAALALAYVARAVNNDYSTSPEAAESIQIALSYFERSKAARRKDAEWRDLAISFARGKCDSSADELARRFCAHYEKDILKKRGRPFNHRTVAQWLSGAIKSERSNPTE